MLESIARAGIAGGLGERGGGAALPPIATVSLQPCFLRQVSTEFCLKTGRFCVLRPTCLSMKRHKRGITVSVLTLPAPFFGFANRSVFNKNFGLALS